jgi:hypothetical protein
MGSAAASPSSPPSTDEADADVDAADEVADSGSDANEMSSISQVSAARTAGHVCGAPTDCSELLLMLNG